MQQKHPSWLRTSGLKRDERDDPRQQNPEKPAHSQGNLPLAWSIEVAVMTPRRIAPDARNAPAISKGVRQRAVNHNSNGGTKALGLNESQETVFCVVV